MERDLSGIILFGLLFLLLGIIAAARLIDFFMMFRRDTAYIKCEMRRAETYSEYCCWRRELRCHRLCLLPFINSTNAYRIYNALFWHGKKTKPQTRRPKKQRGIFAILAPSAIGGAICVACLCGVSWAWFTTNVGSTTQSIQTAQFSVTATVTANAENENTKPVAVTPAAENPLQFNGLLANTPYTVTLTASGTASTGFCKLELNGQKYLTPQLSPSAVFTFIYIPANAKTSLLVQPQWGTAAATVSNQSEYTVLVNEQTVGAPWQQQGGSPQKATGNSANTAQSSLQSSSAQSVESTQSGLQSSGAQLSSSQPSGTPSVGSQPANRQPLPSSAPAQSSSPPKTESSNVSNAAGSSGGAENETSVTP